MKELFLPIDRKYITFLIKDFVESMYLVQSFSNLYLIKTSKNTI